MHDDVSNVPIVGAVVDFLYPQFPCLPYVLRPDAFPELKTPTRGLQKEDLP